MGGFSPQDVLAIVYLSRSPSPFSVPVRTSCWTRFDAKFCRIGNWDWVIPSMWMPTESLAWFPAHWPWFWLTIWSWFWVYWVWPFSCYRDCSRPCWFENRRWIHRRLPHSKQAVNPFTNFFPDSAGDRPSGFSPSCSSTNSATTWPQRCPRRSILTWVLISQKSGSLPKMPRSGPWLSGACWGHHHAADRNQSRPLAIWSGSDHHDSGDFAALAQVGNSLWMLALVIGLEYLGVGLGTRSLRCFYCPLDIQPIPPHNSPCLQHCSVATRLANAATGFLVEGASRRRTPGSGGLWPGPTFRQQVWAGTTFPGLHCSGRSRHAPASQNCALASKEIAWCQDWPPDLVPKVVNCSGTSRVLSARSNCAWLPEGHLASSRSPGLLTLDRGLHLELTILDFLD